MPAEDLVFAVADVSEFNTDLWGVWSYFCPGCGYLNTSGYVTEVDGAQIWGAYIDREHAVAAAQKIFDNPLCFGCMYRRAKRRAAREKKRGQKKVSNRKRRTRRGDGIVRYSVFDAFYRG